MKKLQLSTLFIISYFILSCSKDPFQVNVDNIKVDIQIKRFEKDLFTIDSSTLHSDLKELEYKYGNFFSIFNKNYLFQEKKSLAYPDFLKKFRTDYRILSAYHEIKKKYHDLSWLENTLEHAFKHYKYYFPKKIIPEIYTCITGYNESMVVTDSAIAIALDKYLGPDYLLYKRLNLPQYKIDKMTKDYIATDCVKAWLMTEYTYNDSIDNLLSQMIYHGKILYCLDALFPDLNDTIIHAYDPGQLYWAKKNEDKIWSYFIEQNLLFSTNKSNISRYIEDAPFTTTFSNNSAPRTGCFIGRQIIGAYMQNNEDISLKELMEDSNYQKILNQSGYNP